MRIHEAIIEGAKRHPQCRGEYFTYAEGTGQILASCALGAALLAALEARLGQTIETEEELRAALDKLEYNCLNNAIDAMFELSDDTKQMITELNDELGFSREAIAAEIAANEV